ncbi:MULTISPECIES: UbiD family decarboxylase [Actinomadura]|uniref:UbiD family decarboxylase n=1 Tax=Actinomadura yumaensis TaxID=111807 RepID=A0ABW2CV10_9ACTN|nr:UbiD family decarboxylase [Actinomadura sp. J1-007]MWK39524.1 UbiD family decarboxylase [Actinomadura sp. J1-007]
MTTLSERQDLHVWLAEHTARSPGDVLVVDDELSAEEDVTALAFALAARGRDEMVRCPKVAGLGVELVTNVFASRARIASLFGTDQAGLHAAYQERSRRACEPEAVPDGPVLAEVLTGADADLAAVPMIRHFASDLGRYITSGIVVAEDPDGDAGTGTGAGAGAGNLSYHRATPHAPHELALSLHSRGDLWRLLNRARDLGRPLPVAMVVGGHPLFMLAASARVGPGVDERAIAGGLFGEPLQVVRTPRHGIRVPATAEYVIEGVIDPGDRAPEGPFGEFSGYSSHRSTNNVLRVETICRRRDPVLLDVVAGNSAEHLNLARIPRESEMAEQLAARFPDVTALHYPNSGTHFHAYVALRQRRPGQARQVMLGLLGWDPYLKTVVAVDDDVDVTDDAAVLWALAAHFQPHADLFVVDGLPGSPLDPSSGTDGTTSRMGLDATRGPGFDGEPIELSARARDRAARLLAKGA